MPMMVSSTRINRTSGGTVRASLLIGCIASGLAVAQTQNTNVNQLEKNPERGFFPTATYAYSDIETVSVTGGNLMLNIPIASLPAGRGGMPGPSITLQYNSKAFEASATVHRVWACNGDSSPQTTFTIYNINSNNPWKYGGHQYEFRWFSRDSQHFQDDTGGCSPPTYPCIDVGVNQPYRNWRYEIEFPDGSVHALYPLGDASSPDGYYPITPGGNTATCPQGYTSPNISGSVPAVSFATVDGTFARLDLTTATQSWTLSFADGRKVMNSVMSSSASQTIYDRNGNSYSVVTVPGNDANGSYTNRTIQDSLGRSINIKYYVDPVSTPDTITATGYNGATLTWTVTWKPIISGLQYQPYDFPPPPQFPEPSHTMPQQLAVTQITLPTQLGGQSYGFAYSNSNTLPTRTGLTGALVKVTLPTGATVNYTYSADDCVNNPSLAGCPGTGNLLTYQQILDSTPTSKSRKCGSCVDFSENWTYQLPARRWGTATVTAPDGGVTTYQNTYGMTWKTVFPDGSRTQRLWLQRLLSNTGVSPVTTTGPADPNQYILPLINPFVNYEFHYPTNADVPVAPRSRFVDQNGNTISETDYDFSTSSITVDYNNGVVTSLGNARELRGVSRTFYTPAGQAGSNACTNQFYCDPGTSYHVFNELKTETTDSGQHSEFCYDSNGNLLLEAHGANTGAGGQYLVNCSATPPTATNLAITSTSYTYDPTYHSLSSVTDGRGTRRTYTYDSIGGQTGLYPTKIVEADGTTVAQASQYGYDFWTGLLTSETDPNSSQTVITYDDPGRPKTISKAGAQTTFEISDVNRYVFRKDSLDGSRVLATVDRFDGMGRNRLHQVLESAQSGDAVPVETAGTLTQHLYSFDTTGNCEAVSNPYRSTADSTMGWTRTCRDTLGRVNEVRHFGGGAQIPAPWGNNPPPTTSGAITTTYSGATTTVTDEALKSRTLTTDGAGRLISVTEAPNGATETTAYLYDLGDNLRGVNQNGEVFNDSGTARCVAFDGSSQTRCFTYDVLKRLTSATNPESGSTSYTSYDANGNRLQKTDARGISTFYSYDALNRLQTKSYTDTPRTPPVTNCYDGQVFGAPPAPPGCVWPSPPIANAVGRLTSVNNSVSQTDYTAFDPFGRVLSSRQVTGTAPAYLFGYSYNLAGGLTSITYPSQRVVSFGIDGAGRVSTINGVYQGNSSGYTCASIGNHTCTSQAISYAPHGGINSIPFNNLIVESVGYNDRLQPTSITANYGQISLLSLTYDYCYPFAAPCGNNGNLKQQTIQRYNANWSPTTRTWTQTYDYDNANRLKSAVEGGVGSWSQSYGYDSHGQGNMFTTQTGSLPALDSETPQSESWFLSSHGRVNNQITGWSYDSAGNLLQVGGMARTFTYDAENRQTSAMIGTNQSTYAYDGAGRRVQSTAWNQTTTYVYDAMGNVAEEIGPATDPALIYTTVDALGSTRLTTTASGGLYLNYDYLPFGREIGAGYGGRDSSFSPGAYPSDPSGPGPRSKFTGQSRDAESGLDYFGRRYYSAAEGRFTSPDPKIMPSGISNPQAWNRYAYALNNPLRFIDPDGAEARDSLYVAYLNAGYIKRGGDRSWRNNNPGNLVYSPWSAAHGAMRPDYGGQAIFPTMEAGLAAQAALWRMGKYQSLTLADAIEAYAPKKENNTAEYIKQIATGLGVSPDTRISDLTDEQLLKLIAIQHKIEGQKPGTVTPIRPFQPTAPTPGVPDLPEPPAIGPPPIPDLPPLPEPQKPIPPMPPDTPKGGNVL
jgi:RHS repeat-associated protein